MQQLNYGDDGLIPGIVQNARTGKVLMLGYLNEQSLELTNSTRRIHFWSRSREELWEKGATSGNYLNVVSVEPDCDQDALLILVEPEGPTCHTGNESCFGTVATGEGFAELERLWATINDRISSPTPDSYTARLAAAGPDLTGRKLVEEATETLIAAKNHQHGDSAERVIEESADVVYHLLTLLAERGIAAGEVITELQNRAR